MLGISPNGSYASVRARLDAGWQPISSGTASAATSFAITIAASTYDMVRINLVGVIGTGSGNMVGRVNGDTTAGLHRYHYTATAADAVSTDVTTSSTSWLLGHIVNVGYSNSEVLIWPAPGGSFSSQLSYRSVSTTYTPVEADAQVIVAGGSLSAARTLSSFTVFPSTSTFTGRYIVEGYIAP